MASPIHIVIFGASGDLTRRKLIPALTRLSAQGSPEMGFHVVGVSRRELSDEAFRESLGAAIEPDTRADFAALAPRIRYHRGDASDPDSIAALADLLDGLPGGAAAPRLFYLSLKPELFLATVEQLAAAGLTRSRPAEPTHWRRVVVEKPFGSDLRSARRLNRDLHQMLHEDQIYRIDHYLGKETVQNLLGFRFHNAIFEPLWNKHHVELVQITMAEEIGVENGRGGYYDRTGALRDMVQNHMLQVLALVAMEPPSCLEPEAIRGQKMELLRALVHPDVSEVASTTVRARYGKGHVGGADVLGYLDKQGVAADSETETYVALRAEIDNWRWAGVPFLMRHGKRLAARFTEVQVQFRKPPVQLFNRPRDISEAAYRRMLRDGSLCEMRPNILTLRLQPREAIELSFGVKQPGADVVMTPARLGFDYRDHFGMAPPEAYERLLLDAMHGDQTLFLRGDEIEASWSYADQVLDAWRGPDAPPLLEYAAGSWGPPEASALFEGCQGDWSRGG